MREFNEAIPPNNNRRNRGNDKNCRTYHENNIRYFVQEFQGPE